MSADREALKRRAAECAAAQVEPGMAVGLGTGSTARYAVETLGARVRQGLDIVGIPTSEATAALARACGVPLSDFMAHPALDLTIDGADEVERGSLALVKGGGGALLREKIVASASRKVVIVVDETKLVDRLAMKVPVEIVPFGWPATLAKLAALGARPTLRRDPSGLAVVTDGGNHIADCAFGPLADPAEAAARLKAVTGVVESGLFIDLADEVVVAGRDGLTVLRR